MELKRIPLIVPITVKTEACGPLYPGGYNLVVKMTLVEGMEAELIGREVPFEGRMKGKRYRFHMSAEVAGELLARLRKMRVPAAPVCQMGCDGGFTELIIGGYEGKAHYRWWGEGPRGWKVIDDFAQRVIELVEELRNGEREA